MELIFWNRRLARLCNGEAELTAWAGSGAEGVEQLLNELDSVDRLGLVESLPHVVLLPAPAGRVGAQGAEDAGVLLEPDGVPKARFRDAEAAVVIAISSGDKDFNPEGAAWPRAFATSRTTR